MTETRVNQSEHGYGEQKKHAAQAEKTTRVEETALLIQKVREMAPAKRAELYLRVLARLSRIFQLDLDGESRANLQSIERLMAKAEITFEPSPETQLTEELRAELHPFQRSAKALCLMDGLLKAKISQIDAVTEIRQQLKDITHKEHKIEQIYQSEQSVPLLFRWLAHHYNLPKLDYLYEQEEQAKIQLVDTERQLEKAISTIHSGFSVLEPKRMILTKRQREEYETTQEYLAWVTKYMSWSDELFYSSLDAQLGLILRPQVVAPSDMANMSSTN